MSDPSFGQEKDKEAIKFNLEQADKKFVDDLNSATTGEQVRNAIESLHGVYSDAITDSAGEMTTVYIPMFIRALQNLKNIPEELRKTVDAFDYDQVCTVLEGLSDDFISDHSEPINQWSESIDQLFQELGAIE